MYKADTHLNQQVVANPLPLSTDGGSSSIVPFAFDGRQIRVRHGADGEPLFVARDVVEAVDAKWHSNAIKHIPDQWKGVKPITTLGGIQQMATLTEQGVFFYLARSDKPKALPIQMWLAGEVLPSIRKTGGYGIQPDPMKALNDPIFLRTTLLTYTEKVLVLEAKVEEMAPTVEAFDRISASEGSLCITDAAKTLKIKPKELFAWMRANEWVYSRAGKTTLIGYQAKIQTGVLEHKAHTIALEDGTEKTVTQVRVTAKGLAKLAKAFPSKEEEAA